MSDYIDELVREHLYLPNARLTGEVANIGLAELARAVAESVRASAWVCGRCSGAGWYQDDDDKSNTLGIKCPRCVRGVTFGGEA